MPFSSDIPDLLPLRRSVPFSAHKPGINLGWTSDQSALKSNQTFFSHYQSNNPQSGVKLVLKTDLIHSSEKVVSHYRPNGALQLAVNCRSPQLQVQKTQEVKAPSAVIQTSSHLQLEVQILKRQIKRLHKVIQEKDAIITESINHTKQDQKAPLTNVVSETELIRNQYLPLLQALEVENLQLQNRIYELENNVDPKLKHPEGCQQIRQLCIRQQREINTLKLAEDSRVSHLYHDTFKKHN